MNSAIPLAERLRPKTLADLVGQEHLSSPDSVLQKAITKGKVPSMILWGPPGVGKTTLANIISTTFNSAYYQLSAISSGVKELREVIEDYSIDPSKTPANLAPAVLAHESMMPTGRMGAALDVRKVDGMLFQTLYFNKDELDFNYNLATEFINNNRILISRDNLDPSSQISGELIARFVCDYSYGDGGNSTVRQNLDIVKMRVNQLSGKQWARFC